jgi:two-component system sensor histidine kinase SenX3
LRGRIDIDPGDAEIARLQQDLNDALERLERGYRSQAQFLSNVSHELKTPVAVLLSQAQVLRAGGSPEDLTDFAGNVEDEMRTLARLVESLLLLARVGHGKDLVRRVGVPVNDLVLEAAERSSELARSLDVPLVTNLHLTRDGDNQPEVVGDPELLRTMIENLVRNALRFTPRGEPVDLRVTCRQGEASIRVRDRGPGVPKEHLERIFEHFYQVPGERGRERGTGLGLAIARSVAELHDGRIAVRNLPGQGCEFEVRLPLSRPESAQEPPRGKAARKRALAAAREKRREAG